MVVKNILNKNIKLFLFSILSFCFLLFPFIAKADGSVSSGFSGNDSVYVGNTIEVTLYVNESGSASGIMAIQGSLSYDSSKLTLLNSVSLAPYQIQINGNSIAGMDTSGSRTIRGYSNIMKFTFKANSLGSATVSFNGAKYIDGNNSYINGGGCSKTINIVNPPSSNNNLSSLTVSSGNINFDKNNTNYNISVDSNVTSINIGATAEDGGASVSGTGTKNLGYGNNSFGITVTAPIGATKTYTVNVNRKDDRSSNNKLSSLSVNDGEINPSFNADNESYDVSVPFSVDNLRINAKAQDGKSRIDISDTSLIAEETKDIYITVTAENGAKKIYTIHATRGKDPNKVLSTNNFLESLTVSSGVLSPIFNKEKDKYIIYLPYEVDSIDITGIVEDKRYATIKKDGPEKLSVGNNTYTLSVTAEDNSVRTYTIIVSRGISMTEETLSSNIYLKSIKLKKGSLKESFDKEIFDYTYTGSEVEAIPEDENSTVMVINRNNKIIIMVKSPSGSIGIYTLTPYKSNLINIIIYIILSLTNIVCGVGFYIIYKKNKKNNSKVKKQDKERITVDNKN